MIKKLGITLQDDVFEVLMKDSKRFGLSMGGYLSQLVMQKSIEMSALTTVNMVTDEQLREQLKLLLKSRGLQQC